MPSRSPRGQRVRLTINPNLESEIARAAVTRDALGQAVERIAAAAQQHVPVGTADEPDDHPGELRDSEAHGVISTPQGFVGVVAYTAYYAHMVHNGTRFAPANPWLLNAALSVLVRSNV